MRDRDIFLIIYFLFFLFNCLVMFLQSLFNFDSPLFKKIRSLLMPSIFFNLLSPSFLLFFQLLLALMWRIVYILILRYTLRDFIFFSHYVYNIRSSSLGIEFLFLLRRIWRRPFPAIETYGYIIIWAIVLLLLISFKIRISLHFFRTDYLLFLLKRVLLWYWILLIVISSISCLFCLCNWHISCSIVSNDCRDLSPCYLYSWFLTFRHIIVLLD